MGKTKKSTKKFQKKHLGKAIVARRKRQKARSGEERKLRKAAAASSSEESDSDVREPTKVPSQVRDLDIDVEDGDVDMSDGSSSLSDDGLVAANSFDASVGGRAKKSKTKGKKAKGKRAAPSESESDDDEEMDPRKHAEDITNLAETDPEFFQYLKQTKSSLLDFDGDMDLPSDDDDESEDEDNSDAEAEAAALAEMEGRSKKRGKESKKKGKKSRDVESDDDDEGEEEEGVFEGYAQLGESDSDSADDDVAVGGEVVLKRSMLNAWADTLADSSSSTGDKRKAIKQLVSGFAAACHVSDADADGEKKVFKYRISSGGVFSALMEYCVQNMVDNFNTFLKWEPAEGRKRNLPNSSKHWKAINDLVKKYIGSLLHLTSKSEPTMAQVLAIHIQKLAPYIAVFPKLARGALKTILPLWAGGEESVRAPAFFAIRSFAIDIPYPFIDTVLKSAYKTYVRHVKFVNDMTLGNITFLTNCMTELFGLDSNSSYQHMFVFIRQLAVHLRNALSMKTKTSYQTVYNWQYMNCLRVFTDVLCTYSDDSTLAPLRYPLIQIIIGVIRLIPTPRYFPLRFVCVRYLNQLARATGVFIPAAPIILEVFDAAQLSKKAQPSSGPPPHLHVSLKAANSILETRGFQDHAVNSALELLTEYFAIYSRSIAFPELAVPAITKLRKFAKKTQVSRFRKAVSTLVDKVNDNARFVEERRRGVEFSPRDLEQVAGFLLGMKTPLDKYNVTVKAAAKQREAALAAASSQKFRKGKEAGKKRRRDDSMDSVSDSDDGEEEKRVVREKNTKKNNRKNKSERAAKRQKANNGAVAAGEDKVVELNWSDFSGSEE